MFHPFRSHPSKRNTRLANHIPESRNWYSHAYVLQFHDYGRSKCHLISMSYTTSTCSPDLTVPFFTFPRPHSFGSSWCQIEYSTDLFLNCKSPFTFLSITTIVHQSLRIFSQALLRESHFSVEAFDPLQHCRSKVSCSKKSISSTTRLLFSIRKAGSLRLVAPIFYIIGTLFLIRNIRLQRPTAFLGTCTSFHSHFQVDLRSTYSLTILYQHVDFLIHRLVGVHLPLRASISSSPQTLIGNRRTGIIYRNPLRKA